MQGDDMNKPAPEADFESAVETAMESLKLEPEVLKDLTSPGIGRAQEPHANLIDKSRVLFEKQIKSLQARIDATNTEITLSIKARDEAIAMAENLHQERMKGHVRDLYQIKTLKAAVELAEAALGYE
jgi:hypothetical protein